MISYDSLRDKMREKGISQYALIRRWHINPAQITRLKRNESVSPHTIEMFCMAQIDKMRGHYAAYSGRESVTAEQAARSAVFCRPRPDSTLRRQNSRAGGGQTA